MLFPFKKNKPQGLSFEKLQAYHRLLREHPPYTEHFLDGLTHIIKLIEARGGAVYLYESKADVFLLKTWSGAKPSRFSLPADSEFLKFLKMNGNALDRHEFVNSGHELRQAALFFFQQTCANKVYPICLQDEWLGFLVIDFEKINEETRATYDQVLCLYGEALKFWILHQRTEEKAKKLSELGHVKDQLLANVTHELQTPLNGILGMAEGILTGSDGPVSDSLKEHLKMIYKSGKDLHATVNNILKLTHIEAHKNEIKFEKVNMLALIEEVVMLYQHTIQDKNNICELPPVSKSYEAFVEPDQIRTALMNLIGNSVKFTQNGTISIDLNKSGEMLHVCIEDTGIGIDEDKLELIFEEFYQADGSHTRVYGGTGLGLAIVKKIVNLHGGRIWAESKRGQGAKFTFTVPLFPA